MEELTNNITQFISIPYILIINFIIYFAIKSCEKYNGEKVLEKFEKKAITFAVVALGFVGYYILKLASVEALVLSSLIVPYSYNYVIKAFLTKFGVSYNQSDIEL